MRKHLTRLEKSTAFWILVGLSCLFFLLRLPSLIEPYWYGDEGIYQTIGYALSEGRTLYSEIWDNKTPLLYVLYTLFGPEQETMRLLSLLFGLVSLPIFYFLAKLLHKNTYIALLTTGLYTFLLGLPFLEGNIANAENFLLLPVLTGVLLFHKALKKNENTNTDHKLIALSGVVLGIAFLLKTVAIFDVAALLLFYLFLHIPHQLNRKSVLQTIIQNKTLLSYFIGGFLIPLTISLGYFFLFGSLGSYIAAAFFGNIDYVGVENTYLLLIGKIIFLSLVLFLLFKKRRNLTPAVLFISVWFIFSLFNSFFTNRPYTHYLLVLLPSFCLMTGLFFTRVRQQQLVVTCVLLGTSILTLTFFNNWSLIKSFTYYGNYLSYLTGSKSFVEYASFFDVRTSRDHDIAAYLRKEVAPSETIFFWGDNAQMYYLTKKLPPGRYTVAYHITHAPQALEETKKAFTKNEPDFVVLFPEVSPFPYPMYNYQERLNIQGVIIYEKIY